MVKNPPASAGDLASIPGSGRFPGGGHGNPHQYSCLENPMDRGAWRATVHGVAESGTPCGIPSRACSRNAENGGGGEGGTRGLERKHEAVMWLTGLVPAHSMGEFSCEV